LPLRTLCRKDRPFSPEDIHKQLFEELKTRLTSKPVIAHPDFNCRFRIISDASGTGIGGILEQDHGIIGYFSRMLSSAESRYSSTEKEVLACVENIKAF